MASVNLHHQDESVLILSSKFPDRPKLFDVWVTNRIFVTKNQGSEGSTLSPNLYEQIALDSESLKEGWDDEKTKFYSNRKEAQFGNNANKNGKPFGPSSNAPTSGTSKTS